MNIAVYHELPKGGARRAINEYAGYLKKFKNKVDLYIIEDNKNTSEKSFYSNITINLFTPKKWLGKNWPIRLYKDTIELIELYFLNKRIAKKIDKKNYDVVLVSASAYIEAPFIMRFLKTPFVFYIHDPNYRLVYDPLVKIPHEIDKIRYFYEVLNRMIRKKLDKKNIKPPEFQKEVLKYLKSLILPAYVLHQYYV